MIDDDSDDDEMMMMTAVARGEGGDRGGGGVWSVVTVTLLWCVGLFKVRFIITYNRFEPKTPPQGSIFGLQFLENPNHFTVISFFSSTNYGQLPNSNSNLALRLNNATLCDPTRPTGISVYTGDDPTLPYIVVHAERAAAALSALLFCHDGGRVVGKQRAGSRDMRCALFRVAQSLGASQRLPWLILPQPTPQHRHRTALRL
jgi:hypothetical protein